MRWLNLEQQILAYLVRHPQAQDTLEGIADWWLLEQRLRTVESEVGQALAALEKRGFVSSTVSGDGRRIFRLNRDRGADARAWLNGKPSFRGGSRRPPRPRRDKRT